MISPQWVKGLELALWITPSCQKMKKILKYLRFDRIRHTLPAMQI